MEVVVVVVVVVMVLVLLFFLTESYYSKPDSIHFVFITPAVR